MAYKEENENIKNNDTNEIFMCEKYVSFIIN